MVQKAWYPEMKQFSLKDCMDFKRREKQREQGKKKRADFLFSMLVDLSVA